MAADGNDGTEQHVVEEVVVYGNRVRRDTTYLVQPNPTIPSDSSVAYQVFDGMKFVAFQPVDVDQLNRNFDQARDNPDAPVVEPIVVVAPSVQSANLPAAMVLANKMALRAHQNWEKISALSDTDTAYLPHNNILTGHEFKVAYGRMTYEITDSYYGPHQGGEATGYHSSVSIDTLNSYMKYGDINAAMDYYMFHEMSHDTPFGRSFLSQAAASYRNRTGDSAMTFFYNDPTNGGSFSPGALQNEQLVNGMAYITQGFIGNDISQSIFVNIPYGMITQ